MINFDFYNPVRVHFGMINLDVLATEIRKYGKKILIIYSKSFAERCQYFKEITEFMKDEGFEIVYFSGVSKNPDNETVDIISDICRQEKAEVIVAIGGGAVIDCAKAVSAVACMYENCTAFICENKAVLKTVPLIAIPTTANTGSEMNCGGLITISKYKRKISFGNPALFPKAAFIVPEYTFSVNEEQTAYGCVDILAHIMEDNYFTAGEKMEMSLTVMESLMKNVKKYSVIAIKEPRNYCARANLCWIASWGLNGFLQTGTGRTPIVHAMEHEISGYYDIAHGLGIGIILPKWLRYVLDEQTAQLIGRFGREVFGISKELSSLESARQAINRLENFLYDGLKLPRLFADIGITGERFDIMAEEICHNRTLSGFKPLNKMDIINIYNMCL